MKFGHGLYALIGHHVNTVPIPPRILMITRYVMWNEDPFRRGSCQRRNKTENEVTQCYTYLPLPSHISQSGHFTATLGVSSLVTAPSSAKPTSESSSAANTVNVAAGCWTRAQLDWRGWEEKAATSVVLARRNAPIDKNTFILFLFVCRSTRAWCGIKDETTVFSVRWNIEFNWKRSFVMLFNGRCLLLLRRGGNRISYEWNEGTYFSLFFTGGSLRGGFFVLWRGRLQAVHGQYSVSVGLSRLAFWFLLARSSFFIFLVDVISKRVQYIIVEITVTTVIVWARATPKHCYY